MQEGDWRGEGWLQVWNLDDYLESGDLLTKVENPGEGARGRDQGLQCGRKDDTFSFSCAQFKVTIDYSGGDMYQVAGNQSLELERDIQTSNMYACLYVDTSKKIVKNHPYIAAGTMEVSDNDQIEKYIY